MIHTCVHSFMCVCVCACDPGWQRNIKFRAALLVEQAFNQWGQSG